MTPENKDKEQSAPKPAAEEPKTKPAAKHDTSGKPEKPEISEKSEKSDISDKSVKTEAPKPKRRKPHTFKERLQAVKTTRWIRFTIVSILFFLLVIWIANPWLALLWLLLLDIYILGYVPWTWWHGTRGWTRTILGWIDAIVYALILVYIIFAFIGQNYNIPSSSLEKSLLVGDYLWVNKATYGPRVPNTPVHFPLAHHTMPFIGGKSYLDNPHFEYHRLPGLREVERGDIVVFNFPEGDTVFSKMPEADYYEISFDQRMKGNDPAVFFETNKALLGEMIVRPVDMRENYVKRVIGLPGDRLQLVNDTVYINGEPIGFADNVQFDYIVPVSQGIPEQRWLDFNVRKESVKIITDPSNTMIEAYCIPLTEEKKAQIAQWPEVNGPIVKSNDADYFSAMSYYLWPKGGAYDWGWTLSNTDEFWIPKRGKTLHLTLNNLPLYRRAIETYEGNKLEVKNGRIYINGEPSDHYTFKMDYYWMMGDNRDESKDSRFFGLVPEDHVIGTPARILISIDDERGLFDSGKIRWERILADPNPDKKKSVEKNWTKAASK